jgi:hypothetical protein
MAELPRWIKGPTQWKIGQLSLGDEWEPKLLTPEQMRTIDADRIQSGVQRPTQFDYVHSRGGQVKRRRAINTFATGGISDDSPEGPSPAAMPRTSRSAEPSRDLSDVRGEYARLSGVVQREKARQADLWEDWAGGSGGLASRLWNATTDMIGGLTGGKADRNRSYEMDTSLTRMYDAHKKKLDLELAYPQAFPSNMRLETTPENAPDKYGPDWSAQHFQGGGDIMGEMADESRQVANVENFNWADDDLEATGQGRMTPQEKYLWNHHLANMERGGWRVRASENVPPNANFPGNEYDEDLRDRYAEETKPDTPREQVSSLLAMTVQGGSGLTPNKRWYVVPTVWDGVALDPDTAMEQVERVGLDKFPSYRTRGEAENRYNALHDYMSWDQPAGPRMEGREPTMTERQARQAIKTIPEPPSSPHALPRQLRKSGWRLPSRPENTGFGVRVPSQGSENVIAAPNIEEQYEIRSHYQRGGQIDELAEYRKTLGYQSGGVADQGDDEDDRWDEHMKRLRLKAQSEHPEEQSGGTLWYDEHERFPSYPPAKTDTGDRLADMIGREENKHFEEEFRRDIIEAPDEDERDRRYGRSVQEQLEQQGEAEKMRKRLREKGLGEKVPALQDSGDDERTPQYKGGGRVPLQRSSKAVPRVGDKAIRLKRKNRVRSFQGGGAVPTGSADTMSDFADGGQIPAPDDWPKNPPKGSKRGGFGTIGPVVRPPPRDLDPDDEELVVSPR